QIKDVEIIYNPSPEWQTQSAVINVVLKKIAAWTFNGMANARASVAHTSTGSGSAAFFGGLPKLSFNATYSFSAGRTASKETSLGRHTVEGTVYEITDTAFSRGRSPRHNIYASLDYGMNGENSLEFSYYGLFSPSGHTHGLSSGRPWGTYSSQTHYHSAYNSVRAMYRNRRGIRGGIYYTHYNTRSDEVIYNGGAPVLSQVLDSRATQKVNALNAYADLTTACPHGWTLLYGLSASLTRNTNSQISVSESENMPGSSTSSHIDERSCRLYAGTRRYFFGNRLFAGISLTGELYRMEDYRTFRLLPRVSVMYRPSGSHILQGSYSSYRTYPSYWQLQDYISYSTPYELSRGNPSLRPEHWQVGSLVYVLDSRYTLSAVYFRAGDYIFVQKFQSPDALINITQPCNIDFMSSTQLSLSVPLRAGNFFTSNLTATWAWYRFKASDWHGTAFDRKKPAASVNAQNNFILSQNPRISVSLTAMYATGAVDGLFDRSHYWLLNAGAAASFLNGSLTVELGAYDILERESYMSRIRTAGQWLDIKDGYYSRRFSVDISYKFRGYREKDKGDTDASRLGIE
ncbi:MAG: outer membrane beta-barrel family protein, partial [Muribaculaceae bacterium]|nr:outer membrane beta-barrel family protein [Muribaculaceae bacterium]